MMACVAIIVDSAVNYGARWVQVSDDRAVKANDPPINASILLLHSQRSRRADAFLQCVFCIFDATVLFSML